MILNVSVIGILRGIDADFFGEVMQVSFEAGLQAIEVTMNTEGAEEIFPQTVAGFLLVNTWAWGLSEISMRPKRRLKPGPCFW